MASKAMFHGARYGAAKILFPFERTATVREAMLTMFITSELFPSFPFPAFLLRSPQRPHLALPFTSSLIYKPFLSYQTMRFFAKNIDEMMKRLNSFGREIDPKSIPSYSDWSAGHSFNPFGPEPMSATSNPKRGIPLHFQSKVKLHDEEAGVDVGNHVNHGYRPPKDAMRIFPRRVSSEPPMTDCGLGLTGISGT